MQEAVRARRYPWPVTPEQLSAAIVDVLATLSDEGALTLPDGVPSAVTIERPRQKEHGDYATNVALQLAKKAGLNPRDLAGQIQDRLLKVEGIAAVDVAGPGFLNISVAASAQGVIAEQVVAQGQRYGTSDTGAGERVNVEFVSANPTGPVTLASARWAAVGDTISRLLAGDRLRGGARVLLQRPRRPDRPVRQQSCWPAAAGGACPRTATRAATSPRSRQRSLEQHPEVAGQDDDEAQESFRAYGVRPDVRGDQADARASSGCAFDIWFHENDLHESGAVQQAIDRLTELGNIYEKDGARSGWPPRSSVTTRTGSSSGPTGSRAYLSGDLAYYLDKRERGFDRCIILLGADHHGYVGRLMAMCAAFGDEPGKNLEIIIGQMVNLLSHGTVVRMGKRSGNIVTLLDLVEEIGVDAARYALVRNSLETNLDIDIDLWTKATSDNPVFYVQYAHARVSSILRNAADLGLAPESHPELLTHEKEGDLLRALAEFPRVVQAAADLREPHRIARYLEDTAADYHRFYDNCRVLPMGDEEATDLNRARLLLVDATRTVLANGLALLGVSAPERM